MLPIESLTKQNVSETLPVGRVQVRSEFRCFLSCVKVQDVGGGRFSADSAAHQTWDGNDPSFISCEFF